MLGVTLRVTWVNRPEIERLRREYGGVIFAFWHNQILIPAYTHRRQGIRIMISQSRDGEYIARTVARLGFVPVRGSSRRFAVRALKEIVKEGRAAHDLSITPDGPRGPRYRVQPGAAAMGKFSGLPVIPCGICATPRWQLNTWDRFNIPRPFARAVIIYEDPVRVPPDADAVTLDEFRRIIEARMQAAQQRAESFFSPH
ncbi:MAG: lysophospholipid acyltransferase family protein [Acidobacteria bacterium]|nr:lysophospholipid acyltransferase family protein [Acidobacteriota bacterium]